MLTQVSATGAGGGWVGEWLETAAAGRAGSSGRGARMDEDVNPRYVSPYCCRPSEDKRFRFVGGRWFTISRQASSVGVGPGREYPGGALFMSTVSGQRCA